MEEIHIELSIGLVFITWNGFSFLIDSMLSFPSLCRVVKTDRFDPRIHFQVSE